VANADIPGGIWLGANMGFEPEEEEVAQKDICITEVERCGE
jgi:hypothetical protein